MPRKYPPLTPAEVQSILKEAGFTHVRTDGSHEQWEHPNYKGRRRLVTVDTAYRQIDKDRIATMIGQAGMSRDDFYCQTARTAKKINKRVKRGTTQP